MVFGFIVVYLMNRYSRMNDLWLNSLFLNNWLNGLGLISKGFEMTDETAVLREHGDEHALRQ